MPALYKVLALLASAILASSCTDTAPDKRPDVLLISLDSVRADFLDFNDPETAPNLYALARRGTVFDQAVSGTSWTLPSHAQMFTGMPPALHCLQEGDLSLDPAIPVLPELLSGAGYQTAGFYTCWYLAAEFGFGRGFEHYSNSMRSGGHLEKALADALENEGGIGDRRLEFRRFTGSEGFVNSPVVIKNAVDTLEQTDSSDPLFIFAHFFDPHYDYIPPQPYDTKFDPDYAGSMTGKSFWDNPRIYDEHKDPPRQISDRDLEHVRALYRGEIAWTDSAIGTLLEALEERGRLEETLIIVTADHGEEFFEHGNRGHRQTLYDESIRVPLLIVPPGSAGAPAAPRRAEQVSLSDLMPTVLDYTGVGAQPTWHGRSLRPAVEGGPATSRPLISSLVVPLHEDGESVGRGLFDAIRTPEEKLIRFWTQNEGQPQPSFRTLYYFDLAQDPLEQSPVRTMDDPRVRKAWRTLEGELDVVRQMHLDGNRTSPAELLNEVYAIVSDDLAKLGYAGLEGGGQEGDPALRLGSTPIPPSRIGAGPRREDSE
jgi:arylsulfatase A-like enzyme